MNCERFIFGWTTPFRHCQKELSQIESLNYLKKKKDSKTFWRAWVRLWWLHFRLKNSRVIRFDRQTATVGSCVRFRWGHSLSPGGSSEDDGRHPGATVLSLWITYQICTSWPPQPERAKGKLDVPFLFPSDSAVWLSTVCVSRWPVYWKGNTYLWWFTCYIIILILFL